MIADLAQDPEFDPATLRLETRAEKTTIFAGDLAVVDVIDADARREGIERSVLAESEGLVLHTSEGIGYETSWRQVEAMLLEAAARTPGVLEQPAPFVLAKELGDFCVVYELNVHSGDTSDLARKYTALHRNVLDVFNEYGVQIMTPA